MKNKNSSKILDSIPLSAPVKIKSDGTLTLPKSWIKDVLNLPLSVTKINDILIIAPKRVELDYSIDEKNWKKIRPALRKIRRQLFKERYPQLYASLKKKGGI